MNCQNYWCQKIAELLPPVTAQRIKPMTLSRGVCFSLCLAWALSIGVITLAQAGHRAPASQSAVATTPSTNESASKARREWETHHDWVRFTTGVLGDTVITDSMKALLASGIAPNTQDRFGRTALHAAAMLGQIELVRFLLAKGATVDVRDREGRTPLMVSASGGFDLFYRFFPTSPWCAFWSGLLCQPERSEVNERQVEPLRDWYAMTTVREPILQLLIDAGADISARDAAGRDVFDYVALGGPTGFGSLLGRKTGAGEQARCNLTLASSPEVRRLRLGLALREVPTRFRLSSLPERDQCGRLALQFDWGADLLRQSVPRTQELEGVRRIDLSFLDERLAYFRVTYEREAASMKLADFRATLLSSLHLPGKWHKAGDEGLGDQPYTITCDGFTIVTGYQYGPYIELIDEAALRLMLQREADARLRKLRKGEAESERRKREFKP
jgi:hypothetical protein